ncbi:hypothetical protein PVK06_047957 [Gossypium arboreum]|uniref:Uncharacterized protein n=1 Tax=Gossypium arboreum TaxID=29729 RepID=A0ABR0MEL8_GOSAR|nr:hypothetical protein PVK06_047957 [Gossypium arboreum]
MRRVYYHSGRRAIAIGIAGRWVAVTGSAQSADWGAVCYELLGAIPDNINEGRIEMGWLQDTFSEPDNDSAELERIRYARAYILEMIGGYLMLDLSRNRVHLRWLLKLVDFRAAVEMHQSDRILRQFGFRQPIPVEPEVLDDEHKVDLQLLNTDWSRH